MTPTNAELIARLRTLKADVEATQIELSQAFGDAGEGDTDALRLDEAERSLIGCRQHIDNSIELVAALEGLRSVGAATDREGEDA